jgi:hypothetical protein
VKKGDVAVVLPPHTISILQEAQEPIPLVWFCGITIFTVLKPVAFHTSDRPLSSITIHTVRQKAPPLHTIDLRNAASIGVENETSSDATLETVGVVERAEWQLIPRPHP